ncbi:hypothetical protein HY572_04815 [Candidatus Micrarchaeota archaeon]|nr:hypothetical protein [Candidatus Micrarchaeota archaeon]
MRAGLALVLLAAFSGVFVQSEALECTDFLTFNFQGAAKVPENAFDYNSSVLALRVSSGREQAFNFSNVSHKYFYVSLEDYAFRSSKSGDVYYQNTAGNDPRNYYFSVWNASRVPWFCGEEKLADLTVSTETLSGRFYSADGALLPIADVLVVGLETPFDGAFLVTDYASTGKIYVVADAGQDVLQKGYLLYDAGNNQFFASAFKSLRFRVPSDPATFCRNYAGYCLDASGAHADACLNARNLEQFFCNKGACISNVTACTGACEVGLCVAATPTPSVLPSVTVAPTFVPTFEPTASVVAPTAAPAASAQTDSGLLVPIVVVLAIGGIAYYFLFMKKAPRGL